MVNENGDMCGILTQDDKTVFVLLTIFMILLSIAKVMARKTELFTRLMNTNECKTI